jgi:hypothetical protein
MCMFACNGWGASDGACVHAWAGQGAFVCMRVGMHQQANRLRGRCMQGLFVSYSVTLHVRRSWLFTS